MLHVSMQRILWETKFNLKRMGKKKIDYNTIFFPQVLLLSAWLYRFKTRLFGVMIQLDNGRFIALESVSRSCL